jgi:hypothetical protein
MLNRDQLAEQITKLAQLKTDWENLTEPLMLIPESPLNAAFFTAHEMAYQNLEQRAGSALDWLYWYFWENNGGKSGLAAGYDGNMVGIHTAHDIADMIIEARARDGIKTTQPEETPAPEPEYCYAYTEEGGYFKGENDDPEYAYRAVVKPVTHTDFVSIDIYAIIERLQEEAFEMCGEVADDYLGNVDPIKRDELGQALNKTMLDWLNANVPQPTFFIADQIEYIREETDA